MHKTTRLATFSAGLLASLIAVSTPSYADANVKAGVLTCHVSQGWGFIFGSSRELKCSFAGGGKVEHYSGSISKFGVDIGYVESGVIVWGVFAPTTQLAPGALGGHYGGATTGASFGIGGDANVLIGGSTSAIGLQPISIEGDKGLNAAAGIAEISLSLQP